MFKKKGLVFRLSIYLLSVSFVVLFVILYYNYIISRNLTLQDAKNDASKLTELTVARIENVLQSVENVPTNMASVIQNKDTVRFIGTRYMIQEVLQKNHLLFGASIAFAPRIEVGDTAYFAPYLYLSNDTIAYKDLAENEYRYTTKEWYTRARDEGKGVWSEPYYDEGGGEVLMTTYAVPFYRDRGNGLVFAGVVTADLSLIGLQELIYNVQFFESGYGFMISSKGNIITWPDMEIADERVVSNAIHDNQTPGILKVLNRMVAGKKGIESLREIGAENNRDLWISYASVPSTNWSLGILFNEQELYVGIKEVLIKLIFISISGFLILGFLIFFISGRFVKPIEKLAFATRRIGAGELDFQIPSIQASGEVAELSKSFSTMQVQLKEYIRDLKETTAQKERMESELEIANTIQQQMLPVSQKIPGWEKIDFFGFLQPARQVGGDLYDIIVQNEYLYIAIGDVSGKGIPAALFMAKTLSLFRAKVGGGLSPAELATEINQELDQYNTQSMFVTFFVGKLNMRTGELNYTNAGHNLPFIISGSKVRELEGTHGIPLGSLPGIKYEYGEVVLRPDEKIVLYTDGISEAENTAKELFGEARLKEFLTTHSVCSPKEIADLLLTEIQGFAGEAEQTDDITMLILKTE